MDYYDNQVFKLVYRLDYWVMLNYVFYKFYARRESDPHVRGLIYAPGWVWYNYLTIGIAVDFMGYPLTSKFLEHKIMCFFCHMSLCFCQITFFYIIKIDGKIYLSKLIEKEIRKKSGKGIEIL